MAVVTLPLFVGCVTFDGGANFYVAQTEDKLLERIVTEYCAHYIDDTNADSFHAFVRDGQLLDAINFYFSHAIGEDWFIGED